LRNICVTDDHEYVSFVVVTSCPPFPIHGLSKIYNKTNVTGTAEEFDIEKIQHFRNLTI